MRTLAVLAVMMAISAHQAYGGYPYGGHASGGHAYGYEQPRYVGPLASSVPAGVGGKIIPVSDTSEVAAARGQFFKFYSDQLNTIKSIRGSRYGTPRYDYAAPSSYGPTGPVHRPHPVTKPAVHSTYGGPYYRYTNVPMQVSDTPEVAAAKAEFFRLYNDQAAAAAAAPDDYTYKKYY